MNCLRPAEFMYLILSPIPAKGKFSSFAPDSIFRILRELVAWFSEASDSEVLPGSHRGLSAPNPMPQTPSLRACLWVQAMASCQRVFSQLSLEADQAFIPGPLTTPTPCLQKVPTYGCTKQRKPPSKWVDGSYGIGKSLLQQGPLCPGVHRLGDSEMDSRCGVRKWELKSLLRPQILGL